MGIYRVRPDSQSYGHEIGILLIACSNPFPPGDVGNAWSYNYPVLYETIYDVTIDNIHEHSLLDIWHGQRAHDVRSHLRDQLFDVCTACCRYYSASAHAIGERP